MVVLVICKNEDPIKNEGARVGIKSLLYNHLNVICCEGN